MTGGNGVRRLLGAGLILVFVLLPVLLAGQRIAEPAAPGEFRRVLAGAAGPEVDSPDTVLARLFYGSAIADQAPPADADGEQRLLTQARLAQLGSLAAITMLGYLVVMLAFGRSRALLTCLFLLCLPPIAGEGHVLRPEAPAALFGGLQVLLMQGIPSLQRASARRGPWRRRIVLLAMATMAALASSLAVAAFPAAGLYLLVGGAAMTAAGVQLGHRLIRTMLRRKWPVLPLHAITRRLWPWVVVGAASLVVAMVLAKASYRGHADDLLPTATSALLLPASPWLRWPLQVLLGVGSVALVCRVGLRFGRRGRLGPEFVLALSCAVLLLHRGLRGDGTDALMACVPMAFVLAEGAVAMVVVLAMLWQQRHRRG